MEVATLIDAHKFEDLETDNNALIDEVSNDESEAAVSGLLHLISESTIRFVSLKNDYVQWRSGNRITPQSKIRFSRHVEQFHRLLTKATRTLTRLGHSVDCPAYPHTPLPTIAVNRPEPAEESRGAVGPDPFSMEELTTSGPGEGTTVGEDAHTGTKNINSRRLSTQNLSSHSPSMQSNASHPLPSPPRRFLYPDVQLVGEEMRRCTINLTPASQENSEAERQAIEADMEAGEVQQRQRSASRMEEEERLKLEADQRVREDEREELELLRRVEEIRKRKERLARQAEERLEKAKREEGERMEALQAQHQIIRQEIHQGRLSPIFTNGYEATSISASRQLLGDNCNETAKTPTRNFRLLDRPMPLKLPAKSPNMDLSVQEVGETKTDINSVISEMSSAIKMQAEMMRQLSESQLQLQNQMKELMKSSPKSLVTMQSPIPSPVISPSPRTPTIDTLLAHSRLADTRPSPDERWKGGRDVKSFLKRFKTLVEDLPGITADLVWNEMSFRTSGLALRLLDPFKDEEAEVAIRKAKERYLRIWARTPRDVREILEEAIKGNQIKATDFNGLIGLVAELENYRRQATLNDDQGKFDEPEVLMAIVAARLTCLEVKWSKYALKKRGKDEEVTFESLITFIEDEAAALEEPEGAKARARAHEFVTQLQRQSSFKRAPEKERWGGKGSKFDPLIVNAVQIPSSHVASPQQTTNSQLPSHVATSGASRTVAAASNVSSTSHLSSQASPFYPSTQAQFFDRGRERKVCAACKFPHAFYSCNQFLEMDSAARRPFTAKHKVCFKCANSTSHGWRHCTQQNLKCFWCHSVNHHSTLHVDNDASPEPFTDARLSGGPYMMGNSSRLEGETNSATSSTGPPASSSS